MTHAIAWMSLEDIMLSEISCHKRQILYDPTYMRCLKWSNPQRQKVEQWLPGPGGWWKVRGTVQWHSLIMQDEIVLDICYTTVYI